MTKEGILFDMDGTLINIYGNINLRQALNELKTVRKTLILKILRSRIRSFTEMGARILQEVEDPAEGKEPVRRVSDFLLEHYDNIPLEEGTLMFLQYVKQKNYRICLCTNNATEIVSHILQEKHMEVYFDYVITFRQVTRSKPDPQMYLRALHSIGLTTEECIVFKDTENGVMATRNTGIDVIIVNDKEKRRYSDALMAIRDFGDYRPYQEF